MKKSIIIESDSFKLNDIKHWLQNFEIHKIYKVYILSQTAKYKLFKNELNAFTDVLCITYDDLFNYQSEIAIDQEFYRSFVSQLFNDHIIARMLDRDAFWPKKYGIGVSNAFSYYTFSSFGLLSFLKEKNINIVYFRNTPHEAIEWILAKASETLNIEVYTSERHIFPWLYSISKGFKKERVALLNNHHSSREDLNYHVTKFVSKIEGDYNKAIPIYEKSRQGKGILKYYNPFKFMKFSLKRPDNFINKTKLFFYYKRNSKDIDYINTNYAIFFLQFQPERSTLPEGYEFVDQFYTISLISRILPKGTKLLVKEHPSTFTRVCEVKARHLYLYQQINKLSNVVLCPLHNDSFHLIDHAKVVLSITGTVALESYIRKTPVVIFGRTLLHLKGVHSYKSIDSLKLFLEQALKNKVVIENVRDNLTDLCYKNNVSGLDLSTRDEVDYHNFYHIEEKAHFKLLTEVLVN